MMTLGVVLAGGKSSRFGSDKAQATIGGRNLLDHALMALSPHCDRIAVSGRASGIVLSLPDWPEPGLGPLGGIAAALRYAVDNGCDQILSIPVDCIRIPDDIRDILEPAPAYLASLPVIGLWPSTAVAMVEQLLQAGCDRSVKAFARAIEARPVCGSIAPANINTLAELDAFRTVFEEGAL